MEEENREESCTHREHWTVTAYYARPWGMLENEETEGSGREAGGKDRRKIVAGSGGDVIQGVKREGEREGKNRWLENIYSRQERAAAHRLSGSPVNA